MQIDRKADCLRCKGSNPRAFCGREFCPVYTRAASMFKVRDRLKTEDFSGSAPAPFVGRYGYPFVNVGILTPGETLEDAWKFDAPSYWAKCNFKIPEVIDLRASLVNSRFKADIRSKSNFLDISQEVGMASKPVELDFSLEQKPSFRMNFDPAMAPTGPTALLKKLTLASNPRVDPKVERVFGDTDFKAVGALTYLYENKFDENFLSRLLSVGAVGVKPQRRLVPTRWAITAVDDMLGKKAIQEVRQLPISNHLAFFGGYLGNYYIILFFPETWSYELFESYLPKASWNMTSELAYMTDYEPYAGRTDYADNCQGGYYAARLPISEKMKELGFQSSCLCIRIITDEYSVPLGVWVVREAVKKTMDNAPIEFADRDLLIRYASLIAEKKFGVRIDKILGESVLLQKLKTQKKLSSFL